jgi:hypothetical protein
MAEGPTRELLGLDEAELESLKDALKSIVANNQARCTEIDVELAGTFNEYETLAAQQAHVERQLMLLYRRLKK